MKTFLNFSFGIIILLFTSSCSSTKGTSMEITGTIREQGITTYQYGTHTISNQEQFYALKSENIDLDQYLEKEVTIRAEKIDGYPVDGGPEYLLVLEVK